MKEFILCAAVYYNDGKVHVGQPINIEIGFVVTGRRHSNCYATVGAIVGIDESVSKKVAMMEPDRDDQGFITSHDRYVGRAEAFKIAKSMNQIHHKMFDDVDEGSLNSEDLYFCEHE